MTREEKRSLKDSTFSGWELVQNTARLCAMNLMLHGIGTNGGKLPLNVADGKKNKEQETYEREGFWTTTSNKQLNFVQHVVTQLKQNGRCAIVVPDNVLFEGGAGETIRRAILKSCDVHTLLRLPTGLFYAQGVKANVLFFYRKPASELPWPKKTVDLRSSHQYALHPQNEYAKA